MTLYQIREQLGIVTKLGLTSIFLALALLPAGRAADDHSSTHDDHWHPNHVALFVGGTTPLTSKDETVFAVGGAYERRLTELLGVEGLAEFGIGESKRTGLFAFGITARPFTALNPSRARDLLAPLKISTGPGFELVDKEKVTRKAAGSVHFVYGIGVGYDVRSPQQLFL